MLHFELFENNNMINSQSQINIVNCTNYISHRTNMPFGETPFRAEQIVVMRLPRLPPPQCAHDDPTKGTKTAQLSSYSPN